MKSDLCTASGTSCAFRGHRFGEFISTHEFTPNPQNEDSNNIAMPKMKAKQFWAMKWGCILCLIVKSGTSNNCDSRSKTRDHWQVKINF
jgi:hypothetical protein